MREFFRKMIMGNRRITTAPVQVDRRVKRVSMKEAAQRQYDAIERFVCAVDQAKKRNGG